VGDVAGCPPGPPEHGACAVAAAPRCFPRLTEPEASGCAAWRVDYRWRYADLRVSLRRLPSGQRGTGPVDRLVRHEVSALRLDTPDQAVFRLRLRFGREHGGRRLLFDLDPSEWGQLWLRLRVRALRLGAGGGQRPAGLSKTRSSDGAAPSAVAVAGPPALRGKLFCRRPQGPLRQEAAVADGHFPHATVAGGGPALGASFPRWPS